MRRGTIFEQISPVVVNGRFMIIIQVPVNAFLILQSLLFGIVLIRSYVLMYMQSYGLL